MIVRLLKADLDYSLGNGSSDARDPDIVDGDPKAYRRVFAASRSTQKAKHFVLSYAPEDKPTRGELRRDVRDLLTHLSNGLRCSSLAFVAVLHHEPAGDEIGDPIEARKKQFRYAVHLHIAEVNLATGKKIQLYFPKRDRRRLWAWLVEFNQAHGYACPTAPERRKKARRRHSQAELNAFVRALAWATAEHLNRDSKLSPESWAEVLRRYAGGGRIQVGLEPSRLVAKVRLPGMANPARLWLKCTGELSIAAALVPARWQAARRSRSLPPSTRYVADLLVRKPVIVQRENCPWSDHESPSLHRSKPLSSALKRRPLVFGGRLSQSESQKSPVAYENVLEPARQFSASPAESVAPLGPFAERQRTDAQDDLEPPLVSDLKGAVVTPHLASLAARRSERQIGSEVQRDRDPNLPEPVGQPPQPTARPQATSGAFPMEPEDGCRSVLEPVSVAAMKSAAVAQKARPGQCRLERRLVANYNVPAE